jgi:transcriptional regulator with PAS, ATPase and Fis domain
MPLEVNLKTDFHKVWHHFVQTGTAQGAPPIIERSWQRSRRFGVDPFCDLADLRSRQRTIAKSFEPDGDLFRLLNAHSRELEQKFNQLPFSILFVDPDGYLLSATGHDSILRELEGASLSLGSNIDEQAVGTTAPGISLQEKCPAMVVAEQHYFSGFHWAGCFSIPVWDYQRKSLLGCLDFTSSHQFENQLRHLIPHFFGIVNSLQFEFFLQDKFRLLELHEAFFDSTFEYAQKPLVLIDPEGKIIDINAAARNALQFLRPRLVNRDIREFLNFGQPDPLSSPSPHGRYPVKPIYCGQAGPSRLFAAFIPISDQTGAQIAFLLKLEKGQPAVARTASNKLLETRYDFSDIVGASPALQPVLKRARMAARTGSNILLEGETGTGKELFAHSIHHASQFRDGPFVAINCSAIPGELLESELFGYEKGAYTGAKKDGDMGKFELADQGTLFLDEIQAMGETAQMKLLRVLAERQVTRIGGKHPIPLRFRIIAASSTDLEAAVDAGRFLQALFYRLNIVRLRIPPLRERPEDIAPLAACFVRQMNQKFHRHVRGVSPKVLKRFRDYHWPGNVRELQNWIESAFNFSEQEIFDLQDFQDQLPAASRDPIPRPRSIDAVTEQLIREALDRHATVKAAACSLGIPLSTLYRKMKKMGLSK